MYYVYISNLASEDNYIGSTENLRIRINDHVIGNVRATRDYLPCVLVCYIAYNSTTKALLFEKCLKTGSGFVFRNRHLI